MRLLSSDRTSSKGWLDGPWASELPISVGFATAALDEAHVHASVTEIFFVGHGEASARVEDHTIELAPGDMLVVDPGEARAILRASADLLMFVVHVPGDDGVVGDDKTIVDRSRLGF